MSRIKVDAIETTGGAQRYLAQAWAEFNMSTASINASGGISSLTDTAVGRPQFNLTHTLAAANGSAYVCPSLYAGGAEGPYQVGAQVTSTSAVVGYCGSNTNALSDWEKGCFGLIRA